MMQEVAVGETIIYTYDVSWKESDTHWASRWDVYLTMNHAVKNRVRFVLTFARPLAVSNGAAATKTCPSSDLYSAHHARVARVIPGAVSCKAIQARSTRGPPVLAL